MKRRSFVIVLLSCCALMAVLVLNGCGGTGASTRSPRVASVPTVPYLPPTVVPNTPAPTATATPRPKGPPRPTPTPVPVPPGPLPAGGVPNVNGQLILVSLSQQWMWTYQDHRMVYRSAVTTGMPELPTPDGYFHVRYHEANVTFISPWPPGSQFYYPPEHVNYAMYFLDWGYFIHDAPWRQRFGPGTNYPHVDPDGQLVTGSHGCVELPTSAMSWVYHWAHDGATIVIYGTAPVPPPPTPTPSPTKPPAPTATPTPPPEPTPTP